MGEKEDRKGGKRRKGKKEEKKRQGRDCSGIGSLTVDNSNSRTTSRAQCFELEKGGKGKKRGGEKREKISKNGQFSAM